VMAKATGTLNLQTFVSLLNAVAKKSLTLPSQYANILSVSSIGFSLSTSVSIITDPIGQVIQPGFSWDFVGTIFGVSVRTKGYVTPTLDFSFSLAIDATQFYTLASAALAKLGLPFSASLLCDVFCLKTLVIDNFSMTNLLNGVGPNIGMTGSVLGISFNFNIALTLDLLIGGFESIVKKIFGGQTSWIQASFLPCDCIITGVQLRASPVICVNNNHVPLLDSFCSTPKPAYSQSCTPCSWVWYGWSACHGVGSLAAQGRTQWCSDKFGNAALALCPGVVGVQTQSCSCGYHSSCASWWPYPCVTLPNTC